MMPLLSICIPTYNRSAMLAELLDSILMQDEASNIEVVISDDASPDDTASVVAGYADRFTAITYLRQEPNIGLDKNFLAVVDAAKGDYVWLMGDDDKLEPEAIRQVLGAIQRWPGVSGLTLGVIDYDFGMTQQTGLRAMPPTQQIFGVGQVFSLLADLLGFMSALVVRRDAWLQFANDEATRHFQNYYVQVYLVGRIVAAHNSWGIVQERCVGYRSSNDQFLDKLGWLARLKVDVVAYDQIADALLANDCSAWSAMRKQVFNTHVMARINNAKSAPGRTQDVAAALSFLFAHYRRLPDFWIKAVPTLIAPDPVIRVARKGYQRFSSRSGTSRARKLNVN